MRTLDRRELLRHAAHLPYWMALGTGLWLAACGGSEEDAESTASAPAPAPSQSCPDTITDNHGHSACIPQSVLDNPQASNSIALTQGSGHTHTVTLTMAEVIQIRNNSGAITRTSTNDNLHTHNVTWL